MKVLCLDICFKLPDDFCGDLNDALREIIKYRDSEECVVNRAKPEDRLRAQMGTMWDRFVAAIPEGYKFVGGVALASLNDDNEWDKLPLVSTQDEAE